MSWVALGGIAAPVLTFLAVVIGLLFSRSKEKAQRQADAEQKEADRKAEAEKKRADLEAQREQEAYDRMQEDLAAARTEVRALQDDLGKARAEMTRQQKDMQDLWSQFTAMRRELDAAEAHIADVHRWDDTGRQGPMPQRKET